MKKSILTIILCVFATYVFAQESGENQSIATGLGLFVFPSGGQDAATQSQDEFECYKWAMEQTGYNPLNPPEVEAEQVDQGPDGGAVVGAAGGAAAGAAIGAIAGDAGKGAAIGATVGALRGRRTSQYGKAKQQQQNNQAAAAAEEEMLNNFKKAFTACMTGKGYTVQ
jgi:hypothetical protein